jgi:hypothetical protein
MAGNYDKIRRWGEINMVLEKAWDPVKDLVAERDEIEKSVPWLKGKGATPFPPKPPPAVPPPSSAPASASSPASPPKVPERKQTELIDDRKTKKAKTKDQKALEKKIAEVKSQGGTTKSTSDIPMSADDSQSFQGKNI